MEYTIGKVRRTVFVDETTGHAVDGYRVHFIMDNGMPDYIEIEKALYNAENVKAGIESQIASHESVLSQ